MLKIFSILLLFCSLSYAQFNQYGANISDKARITKNFEFQISLTNRSGHKSKRGEAVVCSLGYDLSYTTAPINAKAMFGVVATTGIAHGSEAWITFGGMAQFLLEDSTTSTRGWWLEASDVTVGRVKCVESEPTQPTFSTTLHDEECGHCLETVAAGVDKLCWGAVHFR